MERVRSGKPAGRRRLQGREQLVGGREMGLAAFEINRAVAHARGFGSAPV
jgi:hypothetical protein